MSDSSNQLAEFWEAVDSGNLSEDEIERDLNKMDQPDSRRAAETGIELLGLLGDMRPTAGVESGQTLPVVKRSLDAPLLSEGVTIGRYEVQEKLGQGGCGVVFRATDTLLHRDVALKMPAIMQLTDDSSHDRFLTEARSAAMLKHLNIVVVYDSGTDNGIWYIASEYCRGPNLAQVIVNPSLLELPVDDQSDDQAKSDTAVRQFAVPHRLAAQMVADLASGVQHAHAKGILHRDIKPANVMVERSSTEMSVDSESYIPKLTDFGLAKLISRQENNVTASGARVGTVAYMAPEQIDADSEQIGIATDIYGLGNLLYELLTGEAPFGRNTDLETLNAIKGRPPKRPRSLNTDVPAALEAIVMKCLEKRPEDRFASAGELSQALRSWLTGQQSSRSQEVLLGGWPTRRRRQIRASLLAISSLLVLIAVAVGISLLAKVQRQSESSSAASTVVTVDPLANLRRDLVTYLPLTEDYDDASGNGIHARIGGGDPEFTNIVGPAVDLDGDGDFLTLDYPEELRFGESSFTVAGWFFVNGGQTHRRKNNFFEGAADVAVIGSHRMIYRNPGMFAGRIVFENPHNSGGWGMELLTGHDVRILACNGEYYRASELQKVTRNRWVFLCMVFDRQLGEMKFWNDDQKIGRFPIPPGSIDSHTDGYAINIGQDGTGKGDFFFQGRICHLAIWRRVLGDEEAVALREAGMKETRGLLAEAAVQSK